MSRVKELEKHCEDQNCAEILKSEFDKTNKMIEDQKDDIRDIKIIVNEVIEIQKNTTQNLNTLTNDVKELIQKRILYEIQNQELENLKKQVEGLEENKVWLTRLVGGMFITFIINIIFGGKIF